MIVSSLYHIGSSQYKETQEMFNNIYNNPNDTNNHPYHFHIKFGIHGNGIFLPDLHNCSYEQFIALLENTSESKKVVRSTNVASYMGLKFTIVEVKDFKYNDLIYYCVQNTEWE